jgi:hypothetical protein
VNSTIPTFRSPKTSVSSSSRLNTAGAQCLRSPSSPHHPRAGKMPPWLTKFWRCSGAPQRHGPDVTARQIRERTVAARRRATYGNFSPTLPSPAHPQCIRPPLPGTGGAHVTSVRQMNQLVRRDRGDIKLLMDEQGGRAVTALGREPNGTVSRNQPTSRARRRRAVWRREGLVDTDDARTIGARARMIRRRRGSSRDVVAGFA